MNLLILLLALSSGETSNHRDIIKPYDEAATRCHKAGLEWKRVQPLVTQYRETENKTVIIKEIQVICIEKIESNPSTGRVKIKVSWEHPTQRVDGSPLAVRDIRGYKIYMEGAESIEHTPGPIEEYIFSVKPGAYRLTMQCIGRHGLRSEITDPVEVVISL